MRPLEALLLLANLLTFVVLRVPRLRISPWLRRAAPIGVVVCGAQALLEGWRWKRARGPRS